MQTKLKKPEMLAEMNASAYAMKVKADLQQLAGLPPAEAAVPFLFNADFKFADESGALFLAGFGNAWKSHIKTEGWLKGSEAKNLWLGTCQRNGDTMELVVKKGKLTQSKFKAAVKSNAALKKLNWNIVEAIEEGDDSDLLDDSKPEEEKAPEQKKTNDGDKAKAAGLNAQIAKLFGEFKAADGVEKRKILAQIDALADQLYTIPAWEDYTDDRIEALLVQVEKLLSQQAKEDVKDDKSTKAAEQAAAIVKQITPLLTNFKTAAPDKKTELVADIQRLTEQLYAVPDWQDHTPDNIEKAILQLDNMYLAGQLGNGINTLLTNFKAAATPDEKQTIQTQIQQLALQLFAIPNWRAYTDDKLEKIIAQMQPSQADEEFINAHTKALAGLATTEAFAKYAERIVAEANTPATRAFAANIQANAEAMQASEEYLNYLLDEQQNISKLINSGQLSEAELAEAQELLNKIIETTALALN